MNVRARPAPRLAPLAALVALSLLTLSGCATKEFVEQEMGVVNSRIETLQNLISAAGARIDGNTARLQDSDTRLGKTEQTAAVLGKRIDDNIAGLGAANQRLDGLAGELGKASSLISANTVEIARSHQRLDATDEQVQASRRRVEGTVASLALAEGRLGAAETTLLTLSRATSPVPAPAAAVAAAALPAAAPASTPGDAYSRLDSLAAMVAAATQRVEANTGAIDGVAARLGGLESGLGETRKRTEAGEQALAAAQARIEEVSSRIGAAEQGVQAQGVAIAAVNQRVEGAVVAIQAEVERMTRHEADAAAGSATFKQLLNNLGQGIDTVAQRADATDQALANANNRIDAGAQAQAETTVQVAALQVAVKEDSEHRARQAAEAAAGAAVVQQTLASLGTGIEAVGKRVDATAQTQAESAVQVAALQGAVKEDGEHLARHAAEAAAGAAVVQQTLANLGTGLEGVSRRVDAADQALVAAVDRDTQLHAAVTAHTGRLEQVEKGLVDTGAQVGQALSSIKVQEDRLERNEAADAVVSATAKEALERAIAAGKLAEGKLVHEAILNEELANFGLEKANLSEASKKALTEFANNLRSGNRNIFIEIQGHTDKTGPAALNLRLGRERAEAVRDFLHKSGGIPLHRLSAVSYGDTQPVADNATRSGRMKNRRVVMVVLK